MNRTRVEVQGDYLNTNGGMSSRAALGGCDGFATVISLGRPPGVSRSLSGSSSAVERQLPKLDVAGSIPVSRSTFHRAQSSEAQFVAVKSRHRLRVRSIQHSRHADDIGLIRAPVRRHAYRDISP